MTKKKYEEPKIPSIEEATAGQLFEALLDRCAERFGKNSMDELEQFYFWKKRIDLLCEDPEQRIDIIGM